MTKARNIADIGSNDVLDTDANGVVVTGSITADALTVETTADNGVVIEAHDNLTTTYPLKVQNAAGSGRLEIGTYGINNNIDLKLQTLDTTRLVIDASTGDIIMYKDDGTTSGMTFDASAGSMALSGNINVAGVLTANGGAVFNEAGADVDFRVESDTLTHALFVNGANGNVGIGRTPGSLRLDVLTTLSDNLVALFENSHATGSYGIAVKAGDDSGNYSADFANKSGTSLMRIRGDGNVGIGTTSPAWPLHVYGANAFVTIESTAPSQNSQLNIKSIAGSWSIGQNMVTTSGQLEFYNGADRMVIDQSGNVGIGTLTPASRLEVQDSNDSGAFVGVTITNTQGNNAISGVAFKAYDWVQSGIYHHRGTSSALTLATNPDTSDLSVGGLVPRLNIDNAGRVTTPYQPAFLAHGNNSNYIPISTVGAGSYLPFPNAVTNIGGHYNSSTYKFTAPVAGMYHFYSAIYTRTGPLSEDIYTRWQVNNSSNKGYAYFYNVTGSELHNTLTDSIDIYLNANDYIGVTIYGSGGADFYPGFQECRFSGYLIG